MRKSAEQKRQDKVDRFLATLTEERILRTLRRWLPNLVLQSLRAQHANLSTVVEIRGQRRGVGREQEPDEVSRGPQGFGACYRRLGTIAQDRGLQFLSGKVSHRSALCASARTQRRLTCFVEAKLRVRESVARPLRRPHLDGVRSSRGNFVVASRNRLGGIHARRWRVRRNSQSPRFQ
jgi:hypothetical protein